MKLKLAGAFTQCSAHHKTDAKAAICVGVCFGK